MSRRGPIYDYKGRGSRCFGQIALLHSIEIINTGGKVWPPSPGIISTQLAKPVPEAFKIDGRVAREAFKSAKVNLLTVSYAAFSDAAVASFASHVPSVIPRFHLQPILNPLKWLLWSKLIPKAPNSFVLRGDIPEAEEVFEMYNKVAAYVFLIDAKGLIRWKAAGLATEAELADLLESIKILRQ